MRHQMSRPELSYWARRRGEFNDAISPRPDTPAERIAACVAIVAMLAALLVFTSL